MEIKATVAVIRAKRYHVEELKPLIRQSLDLIGGINDIKPEFKVFVKINHLSPPSPADRGIVTHPVFTEAVLDVLKVTGADITVGDDIEEDGIDGFDISGYREMCSRLGVKLVNLLEAGFISTKTAGKILPEIYLSRVALEADIIIDLAKFKTHALTLFTGGVKNMYGIIPAGMRRRFHGDFVRTEDFCQMLVDIFAAAKPHLTLMDGIMAMEGEGPKLAGTRLHTRTIIRDRRQAFVGSQSLRAPELDARRELGLVVQDPKAVKQLVDTFESDWTSTSSRSLPIPSDVAVTPIEEPTAASPKETAKAVAVFTKELEPLAASVKKAVRQAVVKAGEDVLHDQDVKATMKRVVKQAIKEAVKDAVHEAEEALPPRSVE